MKRKKLHRFGHFTTSGVRRCKDCGIERRFAWHGDSLLAQLALYRAPSGAHWTTENPQCRK